MNPLQEYPHLFANGKFKFMYGDCECTLVELDITDGSPLLLYDGVESFWANLENSTLIARPIEDISYKEMQQLLGYAGLSVNKYNARKSDLIAWAEQDTLCFEDARKLLSIGVYPFDQSHFEDGTVRN